MGWVSARMVFPYLVTFIRIISGIYPKRILISRRTGGSVLSQSISCLTVSRCSCCGVGFQDERGGQDDIMVTLRACMCSTVWSLNILFAVYTHTLCITAPPPPPPP
ncbi:hypothetical protein DB88DRAFT_486164, partial [Papiliotrema laurentii]